MMRWPRKREIEPVVPKGRLGHLGVEDLRPSPHNPRKLFDPEPLKALKASIREHGVLVPLTIYKLPGQRRYAIVDGERRYRCCSELSHEGLKIKIPANIVAAPDATSSLIYMFNIHQFRQQWELMPTAYALKSLIDQLGTDEVDQLTELTGLSAPQVERCKTVLSFPKRFQQMSMDPDQKMRVPSNFWVELHPVLDLTERVLPDLIKEEGRDGITQRMVDKYRSGRIKSVIHFRRILEAYDVHADGDDVLAVTSRLREYILDSDLETRRVFDSFIADTRRRQKATNAMEWFMSQLKAAKIEHMTEGREELILRLTDVRSFIDGLLSKLEGGDPPPEDQEDD